MSQALTRVSTSRLFVFVVAAVLFHSALLGRAFGQGTSASVVNGAQLLQPADPTFESVLAANFPNLPSSSAVALLRPFLVLLVNSDVVTKTAYAVRWTVTFTDGTSQTLDYVTVGSRFDNAAFSLHPGEVRLLSPVFGYSAQAFSQMGDVSSLYDENNFPSYPNIASVSAVLDGVVSDDESFMGPNATNLQMRYACEAAAEVDEGATVTKLLASGFSLSELAPQLSAQIPPGIAAEGDSSKTDPGSFYSASLARQAESLLNLMANGQNVRNRASAMRAVGRHVRANCSVAPAQ